MRFIFSADLHGNQNQYKKVFDYTADNNVDIIVLGGDLTPKTPELRNPKSQREFFNNSLFPLIKSFDGKVLLIMGNDDYKSNYTFLREMQNKIGFDLIDEKAFAIDGFYFVGYSYVPYTPFVWKDWERRDLQADTQKDLREGTIIDGFISKDDDNKIPFSILSNMMNSSIEEDLNTITENIIPQKLILITHTPPFDTNCDLTKNKDGTIIHVGSKAVKKIIEEKQPLLTLHGHIHDTVQLTKIFPEHIGNTTCCAVSNSHIGDNPYIVDVDIINAVNTKRILL